MAFVLIAMGVVLFVTAYQGTTVTLGSMLVQDVIGTQGNKGYLYWAVAILVVGAVGYIQKLKGLSDAFIGLLLLVLFISNQGFFAKFNQALAAIGGKAATASVSATSNAPNLLGTGTTLNTGSLLGGNNLGNPLLQSPGMSVPFNILGTEGSGTTPGGWTITTPISPGGWTDTTGLTL